MANTLDMLGITQLLYIIIIRIYIIYNYIYIYICPFLFIPTSTSSDKTEGLPKLQPLFISVDPERDTPEILKNYLKGLHIQCPNIF